MHYCEDETDIHNGAILDVLAKAEETGDILPAWIGSMILPCPVDEDIDEEEILDHKIHLAGDRFK